MKEIKLNYYDESSKELFGIGTCNTEIRWRGFDISWILSFIRINLYMNQGLLERLWRLANEPRPK